MYYWPTQLVYFLVSAVEQMVNGARRLGLWIDTKILITGLDSICLVFVEAIKEGRNFRNCCCVFVCLVGWLVGWLFYFLILDYQMF